MVQRQANDFLCHADGDGKVGWGCAFETTVGGEGGDEGVEIAAAEDSLFLEAIVEGIAGFSVFGFVHKDGEVGIVVGDAGDIFHDAQTGNTTQSFAILLCHLAAGFDGGIHIAKAEQAVGGADFIHLAVDAGGYHLRLIRKAEVLEVVDALLHGGIVADEGAAFHGVIGFGGVEGERTDIACVENALAIHAHAEGMGGIVDDLEAVFIGNGLDAPGIARGAIDMHGHDGGGARGDGGLYFIGIEIARDGVDIHEDGFDAIPPDGVGGGHEAVRGGDDLACNAESLQSGDERQGAIGEDADVGHAEVFG